MVQNTSFGREVKRKKITLLVTNTIHTDSSKQLTLTMHYHTFMLAQLPNRDLGDWGAYGGVYVRGIWTVNLGVNSV